MSVSSKMTAIANAIRAKTGKSGTLTLDAMASAIAGISTGSSIQRKAGSFTASSAGKATVSCGFKPDLLIVYTPTHRVDSTEVREVNLKFAFSEKKYPAYREMADAECSGGLYTGVATPSDAGFTIEMMGWSYSWTENITLVANKKFDYVAIKYSA